jgi:hypothetical protein
MLQHDLRHLDRALVMRDHAPDEVDIRIAGIFQHHHPHACRSFASMNAIEARSRVPHHVARHGRSLPVQEAGRAGWPERSPESRRFQHHRISFFDLRLRVFRTFRHPGRKFISA